ncbi:SHOCT domain-containing protein [Amphibacillus sediminis]|uniref:SHOCT domain-containing protein n=1 Tax=Amphibacillus sediminis TaxID=360185 RepID=UPI0008311DE7|nr:SHOCT domain-containing protein [Amphibacillus sediminis]
MRKEYLFKSNAKAIVVIENGIIRITRKGLLSFATQGLKGEKSIPIKNVTAIQLKKPGLTTGYIQFSQHGMMESKGGVFEATTDENTIIFNSKKDYAQALEIKEYIESLQQSEPASTAESTTSEADELIKFKELLDAGVITEEEFAAKKKQILGL